MQEQMQQGNKVSTVSYRSLKCAELAGTPGMKLSMSDQALFTRKLLFRFSYLGKWDFFFPMEYFSATICIHCSRIWNIDLLILGAF